MGFKESMVSGPNTEVMIICYDATQKSSRSDVKQHAMNRDYPTMKTSSCWDQIGRTL